MILRNRIKENFSQIPNDLILDNRISRGARLVAIYLFTKPDGWKVNNSDVKKNLDISDNQTLANYWAELIESGWIKRIPNREGGKFEGGYSYEIGRIEEKPQTDDRIVENTEFGKNHIHSNTDILNNTNIHIQKGLNHAKRSKISTDFRGDIKSIAIASELGLDYDRQQEKFIDYWLANGKQKSDWQATFRNWLRRTKEYSKEREQGKPTKRQDTRDVTGAALRAAEVLRQKGWT